MPFRVLKITLYLFGCKGGRLISLSSQNSMSQSDSVESLIDDRFEFEEDMVFDSSSPRTDMTTGPCSSS